MWLIIRIDMDDDAFQPDESDIKASIKYNTAELSRILRALADRTRIDEFKGIYDVNGNRCGVVDLLEDV